MRGRAEGAGCGTAHGRTVALAAVLTCTLLGAGGHAQEAGPLERAEEAYLRIDFAATLEHATAALESGELSPAQVVRGYQLVGIAAAALERDEESRDAYIRMLAVDPAREVDRNLAPRLRSPFLEARGYWTARSDRLEAVVGLDREEGALIVRFGDPLSMAQLVVVWARVAGSAEWNQVRRPAAASIAIPLEGAGDAGRVEYALAVLDFHGNRLIELGTPNDPRSIGEAQVTTEGPLDDDRGEEGGSVLGSPVFWGIAAVVLVGAGVGGYFLLSDGAPGVETSVTVGIR